MLKRWVILVVTGGLLGPRIDGSMGERGTGRPETKPKRLNSIQWKIRFIPLFQGSI